MPSRSTWNTSGWGSATRRRSPGSGSRSRRSIWPGARSMRPSLKTPSRNFGPCRSASTASGRPIAVSAARTACSAVAVVVVGSVAEVQAEDVDAGLAPAPAPSPAPRLAGPRVATMRVRRLRIILAATRAAGDRMRACGSIRSAQRLLERVRQSGSLLRFERAPILAIRSRFRLSHAFRTTRSCSGGPRPCASAFPRKSRPSNSASARRRASSSGWCREGHEVFVEAGAAAGHRPRRRRLRRRRRDDPARRRRGVRRRRADRQGQGAAGDRDRPAASRDHILFTYLHLAADRDQARGPDGSPAAPPSPTRPSPTAGAACRCWRR